MPTIPASHHDLLESKFATFATIGDDGRPQLSEVWFLAEGETITLSFNRDRQKTKNIEQRRACTLFVLDPANPFRYLEVRGDAEITPDPDYVFATRLGAKYDADVRAYDAPGSERVAVTIRPTRVNAITLG